MGSETVLLSELPHVGQIIQYKDNREIEVIELLASGPFSNVYKVQDAKFCGQYYAMKVERKDCIRRALILDASVLTTMKNTSGFPKILFCGQTNHYNFIIMQFIGQNLAKLRRASPGKKFSVSTTLRIAAQTLDRIQSLHNAGFLNRDIKASNFAIGVNKFDENIYMFDLGLSRKFRDDTGKQFPLRKRTAMLGTIFYAPLASHEVKDQCCRDDLESWFYMCVEMFTGFLPWDKFLPMKDHAQIADFKRFCRGPGRAGFLKQCPLEFNNIFDIIISTGNYKIPDYWKIRNEIHSTFRRLGLNWQEAFDWQKDPTLIDRAEVVGDVGETYLVPEKLSAKNFEPSASEIFSSLSLDKIDHQQGILAVGSPQLD